MGWTALVPVKDPRHAKSRLGARHQRTLLALAFAKDTVHALGSTAGIDRVIVITNADHLVDLIPEADVRREPPGSGLNGAVAYALATAVAEDEEIIVAASDLPCLRPDDIARILTVASSAMQAQSTCAFVPDCDGSGTTMLLGTPGHGLRPQFGLGSSARHLAAGMHRLSATQPGATPQQVAALERAGRDVDTARDLTEAIARGVGPHTTAALAALSASANG